MLGGVLPKLSCKNLHLDLGNTEVAPWDLGEKLFLPISGCRNLHVDMGNDFCRNGFGVLDFEI